MGKEKAGFLTPKAIANRIKSKGLQKLRWYCQMCQKQCRDEVRNDHFRQLTKRQNNEVENNGYFLFRTVSNATACQSRINGSFC